MFFRENQNCWREVKYTYTVRSCSPRSPHVPCVSNGHLQIVKRVFSDHELFPLISYQVTIKIDKHFNGIISVISRQKLIKMTKSFPMGLKWNALSGYISILAPILNRFTNHYPSMYQSVLGVLLISRLFSINHSYQSYQLH